MTRLSRAESQAQTREQLIQTARRMFVSDGFLGTSLEKVAAEAGYSKGAVYSNFSSKFDLGFVVNRTLIYGVLSSVILLVFGLAEWAIEKILPFSHETSAILEAAVALGIFLVFHRVRDVIETVVEKLLFVRWHHNEARLRTFVAEASFVGKPSVLTETFVAELKRFSGGADCRLFVAKGADGFVEVGGAEEAEMDGDDRGGAAGEQLAGPDPAGGRLVQGVGEADGQGVRGRDLLHALQDVHRDAALAARLAGPVLRRRNRDGRQHLAG